MLRIQKLIEAYKNEKATTKILQYEGIVEEFNSYLIEKQNEPSTLDISNTIREIERERIKYFVKEYVLTRLNKIRENLFIDKSLLSESEREFSDRYKEMLVKSGVYTDQQSKEVEIVAFIAQKNLESVKIDDQVVEIFAGDFFVANYQDIEPFIKDGSVKLV